MSTDKFKIESGVQLLARLRKKLVIEKFYTELFKPGLNYNDVVEIYGDTRFSCLLQDFICEGLIHTISNGEPTGVLLFNTVGQVNFQELIITLKKKLMSCKYTNSDCSTVKDNLLHRILGNLHILDIYDATQFYTTIHNLDSILSKHQNISLIIFDSLTAFYWSEQGLKITKMDLYIKNLIQMIQKVSKEYKALLIYTRPGYFSSSKDIEKSEIQISEGVNYKVQMVYPSSTGTYQISVRSINSNYTKNFSIIDNEIKWQLS